MMELDITNEGVAPSTSTLDEIQSWWEVPCIAYFCSLFQDVFKIQEFDLEEFEGALVGAHTLDGSYLMNSILSNLLYGCFSGADITEDTYDPFLAEVLEKYWEYEYNSPVPINEDTPTFHALSTELKVKVLHLLCNVRLDLENISESIKNLDPDSLRLKPIGIDRNGSMYWYFFGSRLYRENLDIELLQKRIEARNNPRTPVKRRGKQKKNPANLVPKKLKIEPSTTPVKRGRGRPRKIPIVLAPVEVCQNSEHDGDREGPYTVRDDHISSDSDEELPLSQLVSKLSDHVVSNKDNPPTVFPRVRTQRMKPRLSANCQSVEEPCENERPKSKSEVTMAEGAEVTVKIDDEKSDDLQQNCENTLDEISTITEEMAMEESEEPSVKTEEGDSNLETMNNNMEEEMPVLERLMHEFNGAEDEDYDYDDDDTKYGIKTENEDDADYDADVDKMKETNHSEPSSRASTPSFRRRSDRIRPSISNSSTPLKDTNFSQLRKSSRKNKNCHSIEKHELKRKRYRRSKFSSDEESDDSLETDDFLDDFDSDGSNGDKVPVEFFVSVENYKQWEVICDKFADWQDLTEKLKTSCVPCEKRLCRMITRDFLLEIPDIIDEQEKARLRRLQDIELRPRKSTRIVKRLEEQRSQEVDIKKKSDEYRRKREEGERLAQLKLDQEERERMREERERRVKLREERAALIREGKEVPPELMNLPVSKLSVKRERLDPNSPELDDLLASMFTVFDVVKKQKDAWLFSEPITDDWAPGYYDVIKDPIDMATIEHKLNAKEYLCRDDFVDDFKLMFNNCRKYNVNNEEALSMGARVARAFYRCLKRELPASDSSNDDEDGNTRSVRPRALTRPSRGAIMKTEKILHGSDEDMKTGSESDNGGRRATHSYRRTAIRNRKTIVLPQENYPEDSSEKMEHMYKWLYERRRLPVDASFNPTRNTFLHSPNKSSTETPEITITDDSIVPTNNILPKPTTLPPSVRSRKPRVMRTPGQPIFQSPSLTRKQHLVKQYLKQELYRGAGPKKYNCSHDVDNNIERSDSYNSSNSTVLPKLPKIGPVPKTKPQVNVHNFVKTVPAPDLSNLIDYSIDTPYGKLTVQSNPGMNIELLKKCVLLKGTELTNIIAKNSKVVIMTVNNSAKKQPVNSSQNIKASSTTTSNSSLSAEAPVHNNDSHEQITSQQNIHDLNKGALDHSVSSSITNGTVDISACVSSMGKVPSTFSSSEMTNQDCDLPASGSNQTEASLPRKKKGFHSTQLPVDSQTVKGSSVDESTHDSVTSVQKLEIPHCESESQITSDEVHGENIANSTQLRIDKSIDSNSSDEHKNHISSNHADVTKSENSTELLLEDKPSTTTGLHLDTDPWSLSTNVDRQSSDKLESLRKNCDEFQEESVFCDQSNRSDHYLPNKVIDSNCDSSAVYDDMGKKCETFNDCKNQTSTVKSEK